MTVKVPQLPIAGDTRATSKPSVKAVASCLALSSGGCWAAVTCASAGVDSPLLSATAAEPQGVPGPVLSAQGMGAKPNALAKATRHELMLCENF